MKLKTYILVIVALLVASCQKVVEFDVDQIPSQMVLNSLPSDGNRMFVNFSCSRFFLDTNSGAGISKANMRLTVMNGLGTAVYTPDSLSRNNYFFPYTPAGGDSLQMEITVGESVVKAGTKVPKALQTVNFQTMNTWEMGLSAGSDTVLNLCIISLDLSDYADEENYYYIHLTEKDSGSRFSQLRQEFDTIDTVYNNIMFMCMDQNLTGSGVLISAPMVQLPQGYSVYDRIICNDRNLNGATKRISIVLPVLVDTNEVRDFKHEYVLHIESVRPERVKYLMDVATATSLTQMFAEPAGIYSNVLIDGKQGLGLFSGVSHQKFEFKIEPWPYPENLNSGAKNQSFPQIYEATREMYRINRQRGRR